MTLTLPTIYPTRFDGTNKDFLLCKVDRSGALRKNNFTVSVPGTTAGATLIGLVPFQKGAHLVLPASHIGVADLDTGTNVTIDIGYTYYDSTLGTSSGAAWASASTAAQAGGEITLILTETVQAWVAAASGWITATLGASATTTTGNIYGDLVISYDVGSV